MSNHDLVDRAYHDYQAAIYANIFLNDRPPAATSILVTYPDAIRGGLLEGIDLGWRDVIALTGGKDTFVIAAAQGAANHLAGRIRNAWRLRGGEVGLLESTLRCFNSCIEELPFIGSALHYVERRGTKIEREWAVAANQRVERFATMGIVDIIAELAKGEPRLDL